jgi:hypothetical protein
MALRIMTGTRLLCLSALAAASAMARADRILLVPLDSRPAAGQFAQLIARMAGVEVVMPPLETLGRYTQAGDPEAILDWLENSDPKGVIAAVVSADMIAYGGLIASRVPDVSLDLALRRLERLEALIKKRPEVRFYAFSAIMRLYPTATRATASWRLQLGRYQELKDRYRRSKNKDYLDSMRNLLTRVPPLELDRYERARKRGHEVQKWLVDCVEQGAFEYLMFGQDDAKPFGPHIEEQSILRRLVEQRRLGSRVFLCEGIDQHANILVSRALLRHHGWVPRVRVVFSDPAGRGKIANYESKSVGLSLQDQLLASGARPVSYGDSYDFSLFLNTPNPRANEFANFLEQLGSEVDQGFPVSVADINLGFDGTGDPRLFASLLANNRMMKLLSYAGWNTAGNTMGTAIPAANVYLLSRKLQVDPLARETSQREFLLHRFVNDFAYHRFTRPAAYRMIDGMPSASREETYGADFEAVDRFVRADVAAHLDRYFKEQFQGRRFFAGTSEYAVTGLDDVRIGLPWPRAYEVRIEFRMKTGLVNTDAGPEP